MNEDDIVMAFKVIGIGLLALLLWQVIHEWQSDRKNAALDQRIQTIERRLGTP